jgi:hypothetical protein
MTDEAWLYSVVHSYPENGWRFPQDFQEHNPGFEGTSLPPTMNIPFPNAFYTQRDKVVGLRFHKYSKFGNVFEGTTVMLARVPGSTSGNETNKTIDDSMNKNPVRLFHSAGGLRYLGLYVMVGFKGVLWEFKRLSPAIQQLYPNLDEWLSLLTKKTKKRQRVEDYSITLADMMILENTTNAARIQTVHQTSISFNDFVGLCCKSIGFAKMLPNMCNVIGAYLRSHIQPEAADDVTNDFVIVAMAWVQELGAVNCVRACVQPKNCTTDEFDTLQTTCFKSKLELQHYLLLHSLCGEVRYESTTVHYMQGCSRHCYTPDFELPSVCSLTNRDELCGGALLIESKASYPSVAELEKCEAVAMMGRSIVLLYGYAFLPVQQTNATTSLPLSNMGIRGISFAKNHDGVNIVSDSLMLCIDEDERLCLRQWKNSKDQSPMHPKLAQIYSRIQAATHLSKD